MRQSVCDAEDANYRRDTID